MPELNLTKLKQAQKNKHGSQYGESGVIDEIFNQLHITPKYAIEFGAGHVSKTGGTANIRSFYDKYNCNCMYWDSASKKRKHSDKEYRDQFVKESIIVCHKSVNRHFKRFTKERFKMHPCSPRALDIVVIDIDGQDYWVWRSLDNAYKSKVVVIEFNPTIPYTESKVMHCDNEHYSWRNPNCLYYGASISALKKLGTEKGYSLVYKTKRNLIFVAKELVDMDIPLRELHPRALGDLRSKFIKTPKWVIIK